MLLILRTVEMQPLAGDDAENCYKNQVRIIKTLKICMLSAKDVTDTTITVIKNINKNPKPLDLIILILIYSGTMKQKNAEALLKQNIRCGFYRISLLHTLYNDCKEVCMFCIQKKFVIYPYLTKITILYIQVDKLDQRGKYHIYIYIYMYIYIYIYIYILGVVKRNPYFSIQFI